MQVKEVLNVALEEALKRVDQNNDGNLSLKEYMQARLNLFQSLELSCTRKTLQNIILKSIFFYFEPQIKDWYQKPEDMSFSLFSKIEMRQFKNDMDRNKDGIINSDELIFWVRKLLRSAAWPGLIQVLC